MQDAAFMSSNGDSIGQVHRLLTLRSDSPEWTRDELAAIFRHQLTTCLAKDLADAGIRHAVAIEELASKASPAIRTFADLFGAAKPPIELLQLTKRFAKARRSEQQSSLPAEIATGIYFLAIVTARQRCQTNITQLGEEELSVGAGWVARQPWCDEKSRLILDEFLASK